MEYVDGVPLVEYADAHDLDLGARLDLLEQVFDAVEAAHRQLVVHRDLKPSNVLVTETPDGPQVKLLDFGIAKLVGDAIPVTRPQTQTGRPLMTPEYAAPEQLAGEDVTTATDVYQLGVVAYELLTGRRPLEVSGGSLPEIEQAVRHEAPAPLAEASAAGGLPPQHLRGDLNTVVQKALRKEQGRRYRSVEALAADVRRYRADEPIEARPATLAYRTRKFVARNATGVGVASAFLALIVVAGVLLVQQRNRARQEAKTSEQVTEYLVDVLKSSDPDQAQGETITAGTLLRRGREQIQSLTGQPVVKARMLHLMGTIYRERSEYATARSLLKRALSLRDSLYGTRHPEVATTVHALAVLEKDDGRYARADSLYRVALDVRRSTLGPNDPDLATSLNDYGILKQIMDDYAAAESLYAQALRIDRDYYGRMHGNTAQTLQNLAVAHRKQGLLQEADSLYRAALSIQRQVYGRAHPDVALTLKNMSMLRSSQGRYAAAESLAQEALSIRRSLYDSTHSGIADSYYQLGMIAYRAGRPQKSLSYFRNTLSIQRKALHPNHPKVASTLNNMAVIAEGESNLSLADTLLRRSIAIKRRAYDAPHPSLATSLSTHGDVLAKQDRFEAARDRYREARSIYRDHPAGYPMRVATQDVALARVLGDLDRHRRAERLLKRGLKAFRSQGAAEEVESTKQGLVALYEEWGRPKRAAAWRDSLSASS
jgi:serine/threonine-protein kinase